MYDRVQLSNVQSAMREGGDAGTSRLYSALPIYRGLFSNNSRETLIARPSGRGMGVFREIMVWPKFYLRI